MDLYEKNIYILLAEAFCYPAPDHVANLLKELERLPPCNAKEALQAFLHKASGISIGAWEELYTRTLDLTPSTAPYVGFQTWGDTYQRGVFLTTMKQELAKNGICLEGELPDHLALVLRYLGRAVEPLPELVEVLVPSVRRMQVVMHNTDPDNPYLDLLGAVQLACKDLKKEA